MSTLKERLDPIWQYAKDHEDAWLLGELTGIESFIYGEERNCTAGCIGKPRYIGPRGSGGPCPTCHGSGIIREPGLVDRVVTKSDIAQDPVDALAAVLAVLHQELGVKTGG